MPKRFTLEFRTGSILALEEFEKGMRIIDEMSVHAARRDRFRAPGKKRWNTTRLSRERPRRWRTSALVRLDDTVTLLEEYLRHRPNDLSAISDMIAAYAGIGNWKGVGKMLDRSAELKMARGITPLTTAYYFPHDRARAKQWADRLAGANTGNFEKTFAVDLYLAAREPQAAYAVMDAIDLDDVSALRRNLLRLQRLCAGGQHGEGRRLAQDLLANSDWRDGSVMTYAVTGAPDYDLTGFLPSDDTAAGRALLARYLISPCFDYTQFPKLEQVLRQQGLDDREVTTAPFACDVSGSRSV